MRLTIEDTIDQYSKSLFSLAFGICQNRADADDIVQDTLIKYYSTKKEFEDAEHLKAWLMRVTINRAKDLNKTFWRKHKVAWEEYMNEIPFEESRDHDLFESVMRLPEKYRIVIHLHYYEEYSVREISEITKTRENTVKSQLKRGRALLKESLMEEWKDEE